VVAASGDVMKHAPRNVLHGRGAVGPRVFWWCRPRDWPHGWASVFGGIGGGIVTAVLGLGLHINLSPSAPRGVYRAVVEAPIRGAWVVACVSAEAAALARARGYLGPGSCAGGVQPVLKPVVAVAGDVVELGPDGVAVNGSRLPRSKSADVDAAGRALPHPARGRHLVARGEVWLVSTRVPNSWDSRYLGPVPISQVRGVARPIWTVE
jgi:conjugative transfer signal peptidase TraF